MKSLTEKLGQMIMIGLQGEALTQEEESLLKDYPLGGFVLFKHNLREPGQILFLCRSLWEKSKDHPPLIAIDQEGGRVHRLPAPFTHFPPAAALGRTHNSDLAYRVGQATACELSTAGINLNFAPVLDVHSNPKNPVIGDRSLSSDPDEVATLGWSIIQGLRDGGIIPCGKHFPGHGDTAEDPHLRLPAVEKPVEELKTTELPPFLHASRNRIESLMTAHVLYPSLDPQYPATLSQTIIGGLLRQDLGYQGAVFGDDLEMGAISQSCTLRDAARLAVDAGVDVLMFCHRKELALEAFEFLLREAEKDHRVQDRADESFERIKNLKRRIPSPPRQVREEDLRDLLARHQKIVAAIQGTL